MRRTVVAVAAVAALLPWDFSAEAQTGSLAVSPTQLELGVGRNAIGNVRVVNHTDQPRTVRVEVREPTKRDKAKARAGKPEWARWAPKRFKLDPREGQTVRALVSTPKRKEPGTYRVRLFVRDATDPAKLRKAADSRFQTIVRTNLSLPIIVDVPERQ